MADYMERETAIKAIEKADCAVIADDAESCKTDYLREIIKSVPAADVAPVVHGKKVADAPTVDAVVVTRCEDCKHLCVWNRKDIYAFCPKTNIAFLPFEQDTRTFFCGFGERKDGGDG